MKLAFTTLSCPEWNLETVLTRAREYGFDGVDFRGIKDDMDITVIPAFNAELEKTKALIRTMKLEVPCLSTSAKMALPDESRARESIEEAKRYIELAATLDCPYIRVFGGGKMDDELTEEFLQRVADNMNMLGEHAVERGVKVLIETHDALVPGARLKRLFEKITSAGCGVIWDMHHPYRFFRETPEETLDAVGDKIFYTHLKDSIGDGEERKAVLVGDGEVPLKEMIRLLAGRGYDGYLALEAEKRWNPALPEPEVMLPAYVETMRSYLKELGPR
jgi:sugar phosphate isomerase/epimerase